jgi:hypothetical protein
MKSNYVPGHDTETERIACDVAERYERSQGREPSDVSGGNRPSCDYVSRSPDGRTRYIEVKGRGGTSTSLSLFERHRQGALDFPNDWWLYAVFDCKTRPVLYILKDVRRLGWRPQVAAKELSLGERAPAVTETAQWYAMSDEIIAIGGRVEVPPAP